jgi:methylmalonyl-CoA/ethylmalonyl-CoA epimerase
MSETPAGFQRITQIGLIVPDIETAVQAWATLLGRPAPEIIMTETLEIARTEYRGQPTPARAKLAFFHLGPLDLELIEPLGAPSTWNDQLVAQGPSLHHLAFEIKGMADWVARLAAQGLTLVQRGEYQGGRYAYFEGGERFGAVVELLEND